MRDMQKSVILAERLILQALNFDLNVIQPYSYLQMKMKEWKSYTTDESRRALLQTAVNFMNDSFRSTFCLEYRPAEIGAASLYLATVALSLTPIMPGNTSNRGLSIATPELSWIDLLVKDVEEYRLRCLCLEIMEMYENLAFIVNERDDNVSIGQRERVTRKLIDEFGGKIPHHITINGGGDRMNVDEDLSPTVTAEQYGEAASDNHRHTEQQGHHPRKMVTKYPPSGSLSVTNPSIEKTGSESVAMSVAGSEEAFADETPIFGHQAAQEDTPSNTPRFSDLARCLTGPRKERSNSMGDSSVDYKRVRSE